jgi:serine/threonine protein kinase/tetratricopeptide (TPR) repeat protein
VPSDSTPPPVLVDDLRARLQAAVGGRYEVLECLGSGGAGVVYRAIDREVGAEIAIKILRSLDAESLYRFKHEFRQIAGIAHRNLVKLYELTSDAGLWFLTMEYVPGADLLRAVRPAAAAAPPPAASSDGTATAPIPPLVRPAVDERKLRDCFGQLVAGLSALHEAGVLHLDIKPSNVRVSPEGRVVILDFGIAAPRDEVQATREIIGTLGYMAPERFEAGGAIPASDWYAAGCLLFECLVGYLPFAGPVDEVVADKRRHALPVASVPPELDDLARLASALSARDPAARPRPPFSQRRPGSESESPVDLGPAAEQAPSALAAPGGDVTIGRERHLETLMHALSTISAGRGMAVHLRGRSGAGKSTLLRLFTESASTYGAVVLAGKCYERESVPYEAVDSIVDALGRFLADLPAGDVAGLLPGGIEPLARVFPTLRRVPAIAAVVEDAPRVAEPNDLRRLAFARFRELVARIAQRRPLVLVIDDLQWGDADSLPLLDLLLERPEETPLLLILAYRSEDAGRSALLTALAGRGAGLGGAEVLTVDVGALDRAEATALAALLLRQGGGDPRLAAGIAAESQGLPYFIHELVRFAARAGAAPDAARHVSLDDLIRARIEALEPPSRLLLELACLAGRPTPLPVLIGAAELPAADALAACTALAAAHLVRWVRADASARNQDLVEPYHDRIGAVVAGGLADDRRRQHHAALAAQLERHCPDDVDALVVHCSGSGRRAAARGYAVRAADLAFEALAFDRAATLYQTALDLGPDAADLARLRVRTAEALDFAGRAEPAARAYLAAMAVVDETRAAALQRQAALQFLKAGHVDDGLRTLETVLTRAGLRLPRGPALPGLLWARVRLRLRGLGYRARSEREIRPIELERIDAARTAAIGLGLIDTFRGALFQTMSLRLALRAGDEPRIVRCLGAEAVYSAAAGDSGAARTRDIVERARGLAERLHDTVALAWLSATRALLAYQGGRFRESHDLCAEAIRLLRASPESSAWEASNVELWRTWSLFYTGRHDELVRLVRERMRIAIDRGDRYDQVLLQTGLPACA